MGKKSGIFKVKQGLILLSIFTLSSCQDKRIQYFDNGDVLTCELKNGVREGKCELRDKNGALLYIGHFSDDIQYGDAISYTKEGNIERREVFRNDTIIHVDVFFEEGGISVSTDVINEIVHGKYFQMAETGDTVVFGFYRNDIPLYRKVRRLDRSLRDYIFDYKLNYECSSDSIKVKIETFLPFDHIKLGVVIGHFPEDFLEINKPEIQDTLSFTIANSNFIEFTVPKEEYVNNPFTAHLVEFEQNDEHTIAIYEYIECR